MAILFRILFHFRVGKSEKESRFGNLLSDLRTGMITSLFIGKLE